MPKTRRFSRTDFSDSVPVRWKPSHIAFAKGFQCVSSQFRSRFQHQIPEQECLHISRCWVIVDNGHLVGYITLKSDSMRYRDHRGKHKKISTGDGDFEEFPAIKIGLLASDKRVKKAGKALVEWSLNFIARTISPTIGVRFVLVDAYYDATIKDKNGNPWGSSKILYRPLGFQYVDPDQKLPPKEPFRSMFFDLKPLIDQYQKNA